MYSSINARIYNNGTWEAEVDGLNPGCRYNISVITKGGEFLQQTSLPAGPITVVTASSKLFM